ncbi:hybrid sensor histidine kinase/response regulator [Frateuria hangzhouensis]|uniref:hybrid sensor histidine kinase/response regulator n=1 Tax=Frateuria hangzhouensis TaxID=2995589 RepID=UPI0022608FA5|nr:PAS domain-containing sensor histidine kinase [Frateuria sp. STR12]MCX7514637.1 PAS domain S-box protein [Frateuria sp. STR12]
MTANREPDDPDRPEREAALEAENARLRAALVASQTALQESRKRLDGLFAMRTLGVTLWAPDLTLTDVNEGFLLMTGLSREGALGLPWQQLTPEEFHDVSRHAARQLQATGESTPYEKQYFRKDGSRWWGLFAARKVGEEIIGVVVDVTARRQVQETLRESEERLRLIVQGARDYAILTIDVQGRITEWLPGAAAIFGWSAEEVIGQSGAVIFTPEDREAGRPEKEMAIAREQGVAPDVRWHVRRDGSRVFIEGHLVALRNSLGELSGYFKIGQDITQRWMAQEKLREGEIALRHLNETLEAQVDARTAELRDAVDALHAEALDRAQTEDALRQAQKMEAVGQLTGGLAHDFNNLLAGIVGSLDLLHRRVNQGRYNDVDRYLAAARGAADRATALTQRLLAFSRRQTLEPRPTGLDALVHGMTELLGRTIGPHIDLEVAGADDLWTILCDPNQLENALLNLCINARDAMAEGGRLTIATANRHIDAAAAKELDMVPGPYVALHVTDTGTGMPPEVVARALDPFYTTKPQGRGTGLGLSMVYGFARQSGGQVRIDSSPGRGTTVTIYLPRHEGRPEMGTRGSDPADAPPASADECVLVVDDEPTVRMLVGEVLREFGYTAIEAADGASALRALASQVRVDLLVTDVGLPGGINGRQLADAARVTRPGLKVLFITGYAENAALGTLQPGMQVMAKPFAMESLGSRIRAMLGAGTDTGG